MTEGSLGSGNPRRPLTLAPSGSEGGQQDSVRPLADDKHELKLI